MKKRMIVGNWKMNPNTLEEARRLFKSTKTIADKLNSIHVVVCPPYVYLPSLLNSRTESSVTVGAQDVYFESSGSFTGEVSVEMLKDLGVAYVITGHSEKRAKGDTDEIVSKKVEAVLEAGMQPIICFGEKERNENGAHLEMLKDQIKNSLAGVARKWSSRLVIAYEPIWAIGAKEAMDPAQIYEMTIFIRKILADTYGHDEAVATPVLYGGAVNFRNAEDIFRIGQVDGLLVGRESINLPGFIKLLKTIENL